MCKKQGLNLVSHAIGSKTEVIAVIVSDPDNYKKEQVSPSKGPAPLSH